MTDLLAINAVPLDELFMAGLAVAAFALRIALGALWLWLREYAESDA